MYSKSFYCHLYVIEFIHTYRSKFLYVLVSRARTRTGIDKAITLLIKFDWVTNATGINFCEGALAGTITWIGNFNDEIKSYGTLVDIYLTVIASITG